MTDDLKAFHARPKVKLKITLDDFKPEPDPPPRFCRACEQTVPGWRFLKGAHPDVCHGCGHTKIGNAFTWADTLMLGSASGIIRRLRYAEKRDGPRH